MSIRIRKAADRGHARYGWLDTWHTFSFDTYYDPAHMGFRSLRVINEDRVQPGEGFGMHGHQDMEIITYVLEGPWSIGTAWAPARSSMPGSFSECRRVQACSTASSIRRPTEPVHFYQIWLAALRKRA